MLDQNLLTPILNRYFGRKYEPKETFKLPEPSYDSSISIEKALLNRRSIRSYSKKSVSIPELSQLLWAAQGVTDTKNHRTAPSAVEFYPLHIYAVLSEVEGMTPGVYQYTPEEHGLAKIKDGDKRSDLASSAGQPHIKKAPLNIIISVNNKKVGILSNRRKRYAVLEAGHTAQNIYLQAESLNLGTVVVGRFKDKEVQRIIGNNETPIYIMPVGKKDNKSISTIK